MTALSCTQRQFGPSSARSGAYSGGQLDISAINGTPIAGHQGPETITDLTIRALLTLPAGFAPHEINSLMRYPGSPSTHASPAYRSRIELLFSPPPTQPALNTAAAATQATPLAQAARRRRRS